MQEIGIVVVRICVVMARISTALLVSAAISGCATSLENARSEAEREFERRAAEFNFVAVTTGANGRWISSGGSPKPFIFPFAWEAESRRSRISETPFSRERKR